jgi:hypothetical protein
MNTQQLPYCTDNGHEYTISYKGGAAHVLCNSNNNTADPMELITEDDVLSIIETAKVKGITTVTLHTNYGVAIHTHTLKTAKSFHGFYLNKLTDSAPFESYCKELSGE